MSAYDYDLGDTTYITYQVVTATGQPVDATVTATVTDPDGIVTTPAPSHIGAVGSGQYALAFSVGKAGVWRGKLIASGAVSDTTPFVLVVAADSTLLPWTPTLSEVADYVPARTRPATPGAGDDTLAGTFTLATIPTAEQVTRLAAAAAAHVAATAGTVDASLYSVATATAAQRAAAYVEYAYPERDADLNTGDKLLALSDAALDRLVTANLAITGTPVGVAAVPYWAMPDPPAWGDINL